MALLAGCGSSSGVEPSAPAATAPPAAREPSVAAGPARPAPGKPLALPGKLAAHRFLVQPRTPDGATLTFFTDTGGGLFIVEAAVARLKLDVAQIDAGGGQKTPAARLPTFAPDAAIPPLEVYDGRLPVMPAEQVADFDEADGMLGQDWFMDRTWTFDYPGQTLWWRAPGDLPAHEPAHRVTLGFQTDKAGKRMTSFPRIQARIDGAVIDLLFDTGATITLSDAAAAALKDGGPRQRATSFISKTTFEGWRRRHPDWRVIDKADEGVGGEPIIEVPAVEVAGFTVGPVWFTRRADKNFHEWMSQWMDRRVDGALGGSALRYFRVSVDYPRALAVFERAAPLTDTNTARSRMTFLEAPRSLAHGPRN